METSMYSGTIYLTAILIVSLATVIYVGSNNRSSRSFVLTIIITAIWTVTVGIFVSITNPTIAGFTTRVAFFFGSAIPVSFLYFFLSFPDNSKPDYRVLWIIILTQFIFYILFFFSDLIVKSPTPIANPGPTGYWGWSFGPLYIIYELFFIGAFLQGLIILNTKLKRSTNSNERRNLKFMLTAIIVGLIPPCFANLILPELGFFDVNWIGPTSGLFWVPIMSYSIIKYHQMNVRLVITEALAVAMSIMLFINIFVDISNDRWISVITFLAFILLAYFLIRSTLREAKQKELLANLNETLSMRVAEQTIEIRKSLELEKKSRRDLEKLNETKDQFIMLTQHHIRMPVISLNNQIDIIRKTNNYKSDSSLTKAIDIMTMAAGRLTRIIDDFLTITTLKAGGQIIDVKTANLKPIIEDILKELRYEIKKMNISISYSNNANNWPDFPIDEAKMREAFLIILENAVKYNTQNGSIEINTGVNESSIEIIVKNTGIGICDEDKKSIFNHLFFRSEKAKIANPMGMGVGLSVARAIIRAHHGELEINSNGPQAGAEVSVKLISNII